LPAGFARLYRSGRPATYQQEFEQAVLEKLEQRPPDGFAQWAGSRIRPDRFIPGCPPHPYTVFDGLSRAVGLIP
jgi:Ni,Fe-hydrogenase III small subunit